MLKLEDIRRELSRPEYNISGVAKVIGVPAYKVRNVIFGNNPKYEMIELLSDYLERKGLYPVGGEK